MSIWYFKILKIDYNICRRVGYFKTSYKSNDFQNAQSANSLSQLRMKGNVITFPQNPDKILSILPSASKSDLFQVAFVAKARPNINLIKKIFRVR